MADYLDFVGTNCLITGGAGFIGSWLAEVLANNDANVLIVDDLSTGSLENLREIIYLPNVAFIRKDVSKMNFDNVAFDYIFHFASIASPKHFDTHAIEILDANILATKKLLELATDNDATFVFASSSEVYGNVSRDDLPLKETHPGNVDLTSIRAPYDEGKRAGEVYTLAYARKYDLYTKIIRIHNTYGPRIPQDGRVIPTFITRALMGQDLPVHGDGNQTRTFLYVDDLIDGILKATHSYGATNRPINLGGTREIYILDLAYKIIELVGSKSEIVFTPRPENDPEYRQPDITLAKKILDWEPQTSLDDGLLKTIRFFERKKNL